MGDGEMENWDRGDGPNRWSMKGIKKAVVIIDYFLPREILMVTLLVFSVENVIDIFFNMYLPVRSELYGWLGIAVIAIVVNYAWGESDDEIEEMEKEIEEIDNG